MALLRLRADPISKATGVTLGRCAACERPVGGGDHFVRMYGELFHDGCAFYKPRGRRSRR